MERHILRQIPYWGNIGLRFGSFLPKNLTQHDSFWSVRILGLTASIPLGTTFAVFTSVPLRGNRLLAFQLRAFTPERKLTALRAEEAVFVIPHILNAPDLLL